MIGPLLSFDVVLVLRVGGNAVYTYGDVDRVLPLASATKPIVAWSVSVAAERGLISLDDPVGPKGSTVRHLLAHASGLPFKGRRPVATPERQRIYLNEGSDVLGEVIEAATGVGIAQWVRETVFEPFGMATADIPGSPAHAGVASASDVSLSGAELVCPTLSSGPLAALAALSQFPTLAGIVPGYGRFNPCPQGLGLEIHGEKSSRQTAPNTSPRTIGHFGQSGSFVRADHDLRASAAFAGAEPFGLWYHDNWSALNTELLCLACEHA